VPAWRSKGAVRVLSLTVSCQQMSRPRRRAQSACQPASQPASSGGPLGRDERRAGCGVAGAYSRSRYAANRGVA